MKTSYEKIEMNISGTDLLDELIVLNRQEDLNKYRKRIRYYARIQLLFIDDFAISRYSEEWLVKWVVFRRGHAVGISSCFCGVLERASASGSHSGPSGSVPALSGSANACFITEAA